MRLPEPLSQGGGAVRPGLWVVLLVLALAAGMVLTLWAGWTGQIRSRHGVQGWAPGSPDQVGMVVSRYCRVPSPRASAWESWTAQSIWG